MPVQSFVFSQSISPGDVNDGAGWTPAAARAWLRERGFLASNMQEGSSVIRFRQFEAGLCEPETFATNTENCPDGVQCVTCTPINQDEDPVAPEP